MNYALFAGVFSIFGVIYSIIGWRASKNIKTNQDYFLAGRNLGLVYGTFTLVATQLGSGMLIGTPQEAYNVGFYGVFYILGMSLGLILLASGFAAKLQALKVSTTAEIFEKKYSSRGLKQIASLLSIITMCGILIAQVVAIKGILIGVGVSCDLIFILFWLFIVLYTMMGGLKAVVWTDVFQVGFILIMFSFLVLYSIWNEPVGWFSNIVSAHSSASIFDSKSFSYDRIYPYLILPALFSLIEQDLAQRFFAAKNRVTAVMSAFYSSLILIAFAFIPLYFGIKAKLAGLVIPANANPLPIVLQTFTGELVFVLAVCAIIAAVTSTADSLLCAITSNIAQDFELPFLKKVNSLTVSKAITFFIGVMALVASYFMPNDIIGIICSSYSVMVSCLFVPTVFAFYKKNLSKTAAIYSVCFGAVVFTITKIVCFGIIGDFMPLIASLIGYFIGQKIRDIKLGDIK